MLSSGSFHPFEDGTVEYFSGSFLNPLEDGTVEYIENGICKVDANGLIIDFKTFETVEEVNSYTQGKECIIAPSNSFFLPGFIDCHTHAPQYRNLGIGLDKPLLEWLDEITFKEEIWYTKQQNESSTQHKQRIEPIFKGMVQNFISSGTTTACYFGSHDFEVCKILCDVLHTKGQRAFVGQVLMDTNCPSEMIAPNCYDELEDYIVKSSFNLIKSIGTPRFALTSSVAQMKEIASKASLIQSHLSENKEEVASVMSKHPEEKNYLSVYDSCGLLLQGAIMAHCIYLADEEIVLMAERGVSVAHCPNSNYSLDSGIMDLWALERKGIVVGLGTDISGGYGLGILDAMRQAIIASKCLMMKNDNYNQDMKRKALSFEHALFLGTLGGANALGIGDRVGSFKIGKSFDVLLVTEPEIMVNGKEYSFKEKVERFQRIGDDRWIRKVWIDGRLVKKMI